VESTPILPQKTAADSIAALYARASCLVWLILLAAVVCHITAGVLHAYRLSDVAETATIVQ